MDPLTLLTLPTDVLFLLFHHLSVVDILTARQVCPLLALPPRTNPSPDMQGPL